MKQVGRRPLLKQAQSMTKRIRSVGGRHNIAIRTEANVRNIDKTE